MRLLFPFLLFVLGLVTGGGCFHAPPFIPSGDPVCPAAGHIAAPFPPALPAGTTSPAGEVAGRFSVTATGESRYAVPLVVPPGRVGMEPRIAIVYDSGSTDGPLGVGFSLAGFSVVTRCPKNVAQDGEIRGVRLDDEDALCLDGKRLVEVASGEGSREYRTVPDTFVKVIVNGKDDPIHVYAKDGTASTYEAQTARAWWMTRVEDRSGNFVTYSYRNEDGEVVPDSIAYTGHAKAETTRSVVFDYEDKPASARRSAFRNGMKIPSRLRLTKVRTFAKGKLARTYVLTQNASPTTGRMRLERLDECAADGVCKQPTIFEWNTPEKSFEDITTPLLLPASPKASVMPMDVNGDGLDDLVTMDFPAWNPNGGAAPKTEVRVAVNAGPDAPKPYFKALELAAERVHYAEDVTLLSIPEPEAATPLDYNDDGRTDLLLHDIYGRGPSWKALIQEADHSFSFLQTKVPRPFPTLTYVGAGVNTKDASSHLADVDGDGKVDLLQCRWIGADIEWFLHRWKPEGFEENGQGLPNLAAQPCDTETYTVDLDADGTAELLMREAKVAGFEPVFLAQYVVAKFGKDGAVSLEDPHLPTPPLGGGMRVLDVNGDALPDVMLWGTGDGFRTFLNTGDGFEGGKQALFDPIVQVEKYVRLGTTIDRDGDGLADFLIPIESSGGVPSWKVMRSRGDGTFALEDAGIPFDAALTADGVKLADPRGPRVFDADGDGAHDVLLPKGGAFHVFRNRAALPDVLVGVTEGMSTHQPGEVGHRPSVAISYGSLVDRSVEINTPPGSFIQDALPYVARYDEGNDCEYPVRCVVGPKRVVTGYALDTGGAKPRRFGLRYRDARWHRLGRGFLGFGMRIVDDLDTKAGTAEVFDVATWDEELRAFPFAHEAVASWSWFPSRKPAEDDTIEVTWSSTVPATISTNGGVSYFVVPASSREVHAQGHFWAYENPWDTPEVFARDAMKGAEPTTRISDRIRVVGDVDAFGNVLTASAYVRRDHGLGWTPSQSAEVSTRVERVFANDEAKWLIGRLKTETSCVTAGNESQCLTTNRTYDAIGRVKTIAHESEGDDETKLSLMLSYDVFGNVTRTIATDAFGGRRAACLSYDDEGVFPFARKNGLGHRWFMSFDAATGAQLAEVDPNELATSWAVDGFGRTTHEVRPDGTETASSSALVEDATGARHVEVKRVSPGWGEKTASLDALGRTLRTWSSGVSVSGAVPPRVLREVVYDDLGERVAREYVPDAETTNEAARKHEDRVFDAVGRVKKSVSPWGGVTTTEYDGAKVITTNARGFSTTTALDSLGRQASVLDAEKGTTSYEYGPTGLRKVTDPGGAETSFSRDALGRVRFSKDPDRGAAETHYNGFGDVRRSKDALGREVFTTYDALGRIEQREDEDGLTRWVWDLEQKGEIAEVHAAGGAIQKTHYDAKGRVTGQSLELDAETFSMGFAYDTFSRLAKMGYPGGIEVENDFDSAGHLVRVRDANTLVPHWALNETDGAGRITRETLGFGISTIRSWSGARDRVESVVTKAADGTTLQDLGYAYDPEQNVSSRLDKRQGKTEWFKHDKLDRLTCASLDPAKPCARLWAYAANGNLLAAPEIGAVTYDDPAHVHAATGASGEAFGFDAVGNQIARPGLAVTYTAFDQPKAFEAASGVAAVVLDYGGDGLRVRKSTADAATVYLDGFYERVTRANGEVEHRYYVHGPERPVAVVVKKAATIETKVLHVDALGSIDVVTDSSGGDAVWTSFDPFGGRRNPVWGEAPAGAGPPGVSLGFTGHEEDDELGLVHMKGRLFDPKIGRFLTPDPYVTRPWEGQEWNPYSYVLNNPLKYTDPSGFQKEEPPTPAEIAADSKCPVGCLEVTVYGKRPIPRAEPDPAPSSSDPTARAATGDVTTTGEAPPLDGPRPLMEPTLAGYDSGWRDDPEAQYWRGIGDGIALGYTPFGGIIGEMATRTGILPSGSKYAQVGRALGEMAAGIALLMGGLGGEVLGGFLDVTAIGAVVGVPVQVVSAGLIAGAAGNIAAGAAGLSQAMSEGGGGGGASKGGTSSVDPKTTIPYKRPSGATTPQQRASVQGKPCIDCGATTPKQVADHKEPLVVEHYEHGKIDAARMRSIEAVQPQCPTCSARQGATLSRYAQAWKLILGQKY